METDALTTTPHSPADDPRTAAAVARARAERERTEQRLFDLLRIESVSTKAEHADDCRSAALYLRDELEQAGLERAEVLETGGLPCVYAEWLHAPAGAPTVLVYGHYDVQPPEPLELWHTPPFTPTVRDGAVFARGAADDKGQLWIHVVALRAMLAEGGTLPVNVKVIFEGEEESGSEHLDAFVAREAERLACDVVIVSDTHMLSADQPSIVSSLRGMSYCEVAVQGPAVDLHSGTFGGAVRNPAEALVHLLAACKDVDGTITIPGFYDGIVEPTAEEREALTKVGFDDAAFRAEAGVSKTHGEPGWTVYEQVGARPTFEINGMWSGYIEPGAKTVLPATAHAKVSMRLVANQDWTRISDLFEQHLLAVAADMPGVERVTVTKLHGGRPVLVDTSHPAMLAARQALAATFGSEPVFTREGGSIPVVATFASELGSPTILMGFGLPDDRLHSPNEKFSLEQLHKGVEASIAFWHAYAEIAAAGPAA
ncbi:MAG: peptidase dimerization domain protein [Thermoleophilia bacterium]|nr:peptidase dimerization domain protein [Thermoleophilia bacterium]